MNAELLRRIETLEQEFQALKNPVPVWLTVPQAKKYLGIGRERIYQEIQAAEMALAQRKKPKLQRNVHYFNAASDVSTRPRWQIHRDKFVEGIQ